MPELSVDEYVNYLKAWGAQAEIRANYWHKHHEVWRQFALRVNNRIEAEKKECLKFDSERVGIDYQECLRRCSEIDKELEVKPAE